MKWRPSKKMQKILNEQAKSFDTVIYSYSLLYRGIPDNGYCPMCGSTVKNN